MTDSFYIFSWWLMLFLLGIASIPFTWILFRKFFDLGYGLSKTVSLISVSFLVFLVGTSKILPIHQSTIVAIVFSYFAINVAIFIRFKKQIAKSYKVKLPVILISELLFLFGLIFWSVVRGYQPDINGLEKFMDYGFINSILKSEYLPPTDMWQSGKPINYYWFGHHSVAVLIKLSSIPASIAYNLMIATIAGFTLSSAFSIVTTLTKKIPKIKVRSVLASGLISAILLTFAGNFHTPFFIGANYLKENYCQQGQYLLCTQTKFEIKPYWYPDATRFIGYNPDTKDKTIHEFPLYSFVVSDLHAHLINLPYVLVFIGLLLAYFLKDRRKIFDIKALSPIGFLLGVMFMTSAWDFGNYFLVTLATLGMYFLYLRMFKFKSFFAAMLSIGFILAVALVTVSPFLLNFESIADGAAFVKARSPIWQLIVLWGFPFILTFIFTVSILKVFRRKKKIERQDAFVIAILVSSWLLIMIPEIIYLKDIYEATHARANTMFKLTYQAYVMAYLSSGYIAIRAISLFDRKVKRLIVTSVFLILFGLVMIYPSIAIKSYYAELKVYKGLDGEGWMEKKYPDEYKILVWLRENVKGQPVILEAPGDSYTDFNMISSYSGLPTVNGWFVHEWLWRGSSEVPAKRNADIEAIYTTKDANVAKKLLGKYSVEYVIVGTHERVKYPTNLQENKFEEFGELVNQTGNAKIYLIK